MKQMKNNWFIELNAGPSLYAYSNRFNTHSSGYMSSISTSKNTKQYIGLGAMVHLDIGKDFTEVLGTEFSLFMNINGNYSIAGLTVNFSVRNRPKE